MSKYYLMNIDHVKTFCQGALGAMSFGAYHQYTSNQIMENNNKVRDLQHKQEMKDLELNHKKELYELECRFESKLIEIQSRRWFNF